MRLDVYHHIAQDGGAPPWAAAISAQVSQLATQLSQMRITMDAKLQLVLDDIGNLGPTVVEVSTAVTNAVVTFSTAIQALKDQIAGMQANGATAEQLDATHTTIVDAQTKLHTDVQVIADALAALAPPATPVA